MPTWGEILLELNELLKSGRKDALDVTRRKYLKQLHAHTNRDTILYATKWTEAAADVSPGLLQINFEDVHGMMEVVKGLNSKKLDLILHSPGGSPDATKAVVDYLRKKFDDIRVIVPQAAMSAATMLTCAADRVVLGKHSSLGPIDPQMNLATPLGIRAVPAQAIRDQFRQAQDECKDPHKLASWLPILNQYGPGLLIECENAQKLSEELVSTWLTQYMFKGDPEATKKGTAIAKSLADHKSHKSHGRVIDRDEARKLGGVGLKVEDLEKDQTFQDLVLSVFHATAHTLNQPGPVKIVENHQGKAFVKLQQVIQVQQIQQVALPVPMPEKAASPVPKPGP